MALSTRSTSQPAVGPTRARQGRLGRPVLWVLLCSLLLVVIGFFAAWTWKAGDFAKVPPGTVQSQSAARAFNAPEPAPVNPQPYQKATDPSTNHTHP